MMTSTVSILSPRALGHFFHELDRRSRVLSVTGWIHLALAAVFLVLLPLDSRLVIGINPWIKPLKFAISIAIYVWTMAWFLGYLRLPGWGKRVLSWGISICMLAESVCILIQATRGTTSHYNVSTALDATIFSIMGAMIANNTILALAVLICFLKTKPELPEPYLLGIRAGLILFLLASAVGGIMIQHKSHSVGVTDGGAGLPFVNWSTQGGDLRAAHFLGLHALQLIPIMGFLISRQKRWPDAKKTALVLVFAGTYTALFSFLYFEAMRGVPVLRM